MSIEPITLHRFCMATGKCPQPMRLLGGTCATNGFLLVWVPQPYDYDRPQDATLAASLEKMLGQARDAAANRYFTGAWIDVASIRLRHDECPRCEGAGFIHTRTCGDCGGDGVFRHGRHYYDCKECDSEGSIVTPAAHGAGDTCHWCYGSGLRSGPTDFAITGWPGKTANQSLVKLLAMLPGAQLRHEPLEHQIKSDPLIPVRFDGGVGVLMPLRDKPLAAAPVEGGAE